MRASFADKEVMKRVDNITIQVYIIFIGRHFADKEVMKCEPEKEKTPHEAGQKEADDD